LSTNIFGKRLNAQVEERLEFYKSGKAPRKNQEVMAEAVFAADTEAAEIRKAKKQARKQKKEQAAVAEEAPKKKKKKDTVQEAPAVVPVAESKPKKAKKEKLAEAPVAAPPSEKKKKKKHSNDAEI